MALSKEQFVFIADSTVEQSKCDMWYDMRIGRTTSSIGLPQRFGKPVVSVSNTKNINLSVKWKHYMFSVFIII